MSTQAWYVLIPTDVEHEWEVLLKTANYGYGCGYTHAVFEYWSMIDACRDMPVDNVCKVVPVEDCEPLATGDDCNTELVVWKGSNK